MMVLNIVTKHVSFYITVTANKDLNVAIDGKVEAYNFLLRYADIVSRKNWTDELKIRNIPANLDGFASQCFRVACRDPARAGEVPFTWQIFCVEF
ncbi:unnamed protein product [Orchesella dallaii]|uniref:Uncharacterized protein n=1 Tax=Orchesella dallaii TaxID=48710 RepID=A0ABP1RB66_9HEXA